MSMAGGMGVESGGQSGGEGSREAADAGSTGGSQPGDLSQLVDAVTDWGNDYEIEPADLARLTRQLAEPSSGLSTIADALDELADAANLEGQEIFSEAAAAVRDMGAKRAEPFGDSYEAHIATRRIHHPLAAALCIDHLERSGNRHIVTALHAASRGDTATRGEWVRERVLPFLDALRAARA